MINWMYYPKNRPLDDISVQVVKAFESVSTQIDSFDNQLKSDDVLSTVRPKLEALGFIVEKARKVKTLWQFQCFMV